MALQINWPDNLTDREILGALRPIRESEAVSEFEHFVLKLERSGFSASGLDWRNNSACIEVWLNSIEHESVAKELGTMTPVELDSPEAAEMKAEHERYEQMRVRAERPRPEPNEWDDEIEESLLAAE